MCNYFTDGESALYNQPINKEEVNMTYERMMELVNKRMFESTNELINELKIVKNSSDDVKKDFIRNNEVLFEGFYDLDIDTLMNTYDINYLLDDSQFTLEKLNYFRTGVLKRILLEVDNISGHINGNAREELFFKLESKGDECDESGVYVLYTEGDRKCEIGCDSEYLGGLCRYMSYSELVEFSNAVNHVIKMMEDNMKEK